MRILPLVAVTLILTSSVVAQAGDPQKPRASASSTAAPSRSRAAGQPGGTIIVGTTAGWLMTDEERIEKRTRSLQPATRASESTAEPGYHESIDGHRNPELFFAYELFDYVLWGFNTGTRRAENAHRLFDPKIQALGYDVDTFWTTLRSAAQPYMTLRELRHQHGQAPTELKSVTRSEPSGGKQPLVMIDRDICAARFTALQEARRLFGGQEFDRLLYSVVAPEMNHTEGGSAPNRAEQLRYMSGGCK